MLSVATYRWVSSLLLAACLLNEAHAIDPHRKFSQYARQRWNAANGLPGGAVHAIAQSRDGYLWIGTDKGLVRFDGFTFLPVPAQSHQLQDDPILGLITDAQGDLWVRMQTAGILHYNRGEFENLASETIATMTQVTAIARGNSAGILVSDLLGGTLRLREGALDRVAAARILPLSSVTMSMAETASGKIWLGTLGAGLFYLENGHPTRVTQGLTENKINCLLPVGDQELWVGTDHGLFRWNGTGFRRVGLGPSLRDQPVLTMLRDRDSNIWVGTTQGLLRINASGGSFTEEEGMQGAGAVNSLFEDREGNLWAGGAMGLERIRDSAFITYPAENGLSSTATGPIYVDGEDRTWVAPEKGGLLWIKDGRVHRVKSEGFEKDVIYSIAGGNHELWIGRRQGGLTRLKYSGGIITTETYGRTTGLEQSSVYATYLSHDGAVWAGTLTRGVSRLKDGKSSAYTVAKGLASNTVSAVLEGRDGTMWFGTPLGLSALSNGQWRTYSSQDGLPSESVNCLFDDSTGVLWIGTSAGLAYFQTGSMHTPQKVPKLLREQILGMAEDKSGRLWIATSEHVLRVSRDQLLSGIVQTADVREYGQADGLESTAGVKRSRSVVSDTAGRVWISLSSGLSVVNPSDINDNSVPALPHIEAITADNNTVNLAASVRIPPSPRRITFEYTGLSLAAPERVRFRYFLENFDRSWSQPVEAREAVYTNLGPGSYRFRLVASNSDGLWNGPETLIVLNVVPAYYQTYWFRLSSIAALIGLFWALHRWRVLQLKSQERRLRDAVEAIPAMTFTALANGSFTFVNKRWTEYTGLSVEQTSGAGWQRAVHPQDLERHSEKWLTSVKTGQIFEDEARFRRAPGGEYRWFLVRGVPLRDVGGKIVKWYGTLTDIEDRKRAEEALQKSEFYLAEGQRLAHTGSCAFNPCGFFEYWSQELFKMYGLDPQKGPPTLEQYLAIIHPQDRELVAKTMKSMQAGGGVCDVKMRIVRPDGELRYIRWVGIPVVEGEVLKRFLGTAIDITEQELLTRELERHQAHLTQAQKLTHTGSWAWRLADGKTVHLSEEWFQIYGFDPAMGTPTPEEYLGRVHPDDRHQWKSTIDRAILEKAVYDQEFRIVWPNGKVKWIHSVGHPVCSTAGYLEHFVGSSTDITERKSSEQEREKLRQLEAELAHINRVSMLGEMAASLAHEIKQPLAAAITSANTCMEWLAHDPPNLDRARAAASRIDKYGNRAAAIIDRIRSFYKKSPPRRELVDVNGIIQEILTLLKGEATRYSIEMRTSLSEELPKVMADRIQLQQVLMNLMLNAIEAMKDSGGELMVMSERQDFQLLLSVSDKGVGLPAQKVEQIFSAFFTTKPQGSGMGLAISRSIVESHGGQLWASANDGQGATFYFTLPADQEDSMTRSA